VLHLAPNPEDCELEFKILGIVDEKWDLTTEYGGTAKPSPKRAKFPNER
jgi:hypothetical protein